jgi:uncharacterized membrane protein
MTEPEPVPREGREASRLEAFSDGVLAVIITIMALGLVEPQGSTFRDLGKSIPSLLVYVLSYTYVGIYWNNHHHLLRATERINGGVMWFNLHLLFWLSLTPVLTKWMAGYYRSHLPASVYGMADFGAAIAYTLLLRAIIRSNGRDSAVAQAVGRDLKGNLSLFLYAAGIGLAWVTPWISYGLYATVSLIWFVPDRRFERTPHPEGAPLADDPGSPL